MKRKLKLTTMQITAGESIAMTTKSVRDASFREKEGLTQEQVINEFLDKILEFKQIVKEKSKQIDNAVESIESITWFDFKLFDDDLKHKLNDLIASTKDWIDTLEKWYQKCKNFCGKEEIASEEMDEFRASLDDLSESNNDLEKVFFTHVKDEVFIQNTRDLINM